MAPPALTYLKAVAMELKGEVLAPDLKSRLIAEESFIEGYEACNVDDGVWGRMVELDAVEMKKTSEERVDREAEAVEETRHKAMGQWPEQERQCGGATPAGHQGRGESVQDRPTFLVGQGGSPSVNMYTRRVGRVGRAVAPWPGGLRHRMN